MRGEAWTIERIALLKALWADGATAAAIAECLGGISRSAVLGKVARLRLKPAPMPRGKGKSHDQGEAQADAAAAAGKAGAPHLFCSPARRRRVQRSEPQPGVAAKICGKALFELTNESCRWPFGHPGTTTFHFCGVAEADLLGGRPYCARHARRAAYSGEAATGGESRAPVRHAPIPAISMRTRQWKVRS